MWGLWIGLASAAAPEAEALPVIAVLPGGAAEEPALRKAVVAALTERGYDRARLISPEELAASVDLLSVSRAPGCRVPAESWGLGVEAAAEALASDEWEEAWRLLRELDRDRACLTGPPGEREVARYHLTAATLSIYAAEEGEAWGDAVMEIRAAAALDPAIVEEEAADPEVLARVVAAREEAQVQAQAQARAQGQGSLWVAGSLPASVEGRALAGGAAWPVGDTAEAWVWGGDPVRAVGLVELRDRPTVLWVDLEPADAGDVVAAAGALREREPSERDQRLLAAVAGAAGSAGAPVIYLSAGFGKVQVWRAEGDRLVRVEAGRAPAGARASSGSGAGGAGGSGGSAVATAYEPYPPIDRWRAAYGVHLGGGFSNQVSVAGGGGGPGLYARWRMNDYFSVAFASSLLLTAVEGGYDGAAPLRFGLRFGPQTSRWVGEVGVDAGVNWLGAFTPDSFSPLVGASAGASGHLGPETALRVELWAAAGLQHGLFGLSLGVEGRLRARTELVGPTGPAEAR